MIVYLRLLSTSFGFAINALRTNKLRTALSFLGVTIGIFSIIAVLAAVDSMDKNIKSELSGFDRNMIYVFNYSFGPSEVPKWKSEQYPKMKYEEYDYLKRNLSGVEYASFNYFTKSEQMKYGSNYAEVIMRPCSSDMQYLDNVKVSNGRFFSESESVNGVPVVVIGHEVANTLFNGLNPVGQEVRLYGKRFTVIGVIEKQGSISIGGNQDESVYMPVNIMRQMYGDNSLVATTVVILKPSSGVDIKHFEDEITNKLKLFRGLKPSDEKNFFVNVFGGMLDMIEKIIGQMNVVGWIISGFSLLVGGFGIANIMFVSVKERTHLIGIQKAIGAKRRFILFQFLFEAVILSLIGGVVGIIMVWGIAVLVSNVVDFEFVLSLSNICIGLTLSAFIGVLSGYLPARSAARLDPVEAIRMGG
ncbi:ABC transporter permease [Myroides marinus]|uniref:ABC transporter permease n=1 Tax=Myroides marinus TaxID=703342 RepID=A0A163XRL5_9FLAO|nr:ABC transporter permease [Myroides marinus]KZE78318.1 ABC transporter permease [Myroides marinus]MDM1347791.1 ABC transporter permease [Myroides marinus]MDM1351463.1 ABC transporter permease [Myroides marinus]MDM1355154.1 ABC transporter permease [Myroides marinus]MDM1358670.1 ABC transporter permease [Myroides marinus]